MSLELSLMASSCFGVSGLLNGDLFWACYYMGEYEVISNESLLTYLLTYLLTHSLTHSLTRSFAPCSRVLLEKPTGSQLDK